MRAGEDRLLSGITNSGLTSVLLEGGGNNATVAADTDEADWRQYFSVGR
jgi:hypothetical protein